MIDRYTGDFSREEDRHLPSAEIPPENLRPHVVICESTYGKENHKDRKEREQELTGSFFSTFPSIF